MKKQVWISAVGLFAAATMVSGQEPPSPEKKALQVYIRTAVGDQLNLNGSPVGIGTTVVKGKPFSATEEQHFLQTLSDGTRVETRQTTRLYRDGEGRTRMEDTTGGTKTQPGFEFGPITIVDPVTNTRTALNPQTRQKLTQPGVGALFALRTGGAVAQGGTTGLNAITIVQQRATGDSKASPAEDLGTKNVNGVMARGERTVTVIPAAEIGANRDIRVVNERWYSEDLQLLIKSTNTDPRFGDTTYQLTGISQGEQSPSLFQVPADYTEAAGRGGGRGARSGGAPTADPLTGAPKGRGKGRGAEAATK